MGIGKPLVIVESRAKAKLMAKLLGKGFVVKASLGQVKELAARLDPDFRPHYAPLGAQRKILAELKQAAADADHIYVAAEPDGEGETLCHHLQQELTSARGPAFHRVVLHELTTEGVQRAFAHAVAVNMNLVEARHARLVVERLNGDAAEFENEFAEIESGHADWRLVIMNIQERIAPPPVALTAKVAKRAVAAATCPQCRSALVTKAGRFGHFLACSAYPRCKFVQQTKTGVACPACNEGQILERRAQNGRVFYGCHRYPACDFTASAKPVAGKCPQCSSPYLVEKVLKRGRWAQCPNKQCRWQQELVHEA